MARDKEWVRSEDVGLRRCPFLAATATTSLQIVSQNCEFGLVWMECECEYKAINCFRGQRGRPAMEVEFGCCMLPGGHGLSPGGCK